MSKGPQGQKRKADVVGNAVLIGRIAIGEVEDAPDTTRKAAAPRSQSAKKGAAARSAKLTPEQRSEIARMAADARWKKS